MLHVELRLRILQGHTDTINTRDGFIYSLSSMEKSLYTKEILHFPVFPLKEVT